MEIMSIRVKIKNTENGKTIEKIWKVKFILRRARKLTNIYVDVQEKKGENIEVTKLGMKEGTLI